MTGLTVYRASVLILACLVAGGTAFAQSAAEYNSSGVDFYKAQQWNQALDAFHHAYELAPDNETIRRNLCNTYQAAAHDLAKSGDAQDISSGADLLTEAISIDPKNASPLIQLGSYYLRLDLDNDAVFRLEEALELDPDNITAMDLLGDAYYKNNDLASALAMWNYVAKKDPKRPGLKSKLLKATREADVEDNYKKTESRHFTVSFAPGTRHYEISGVLRILETAYLEIGRKLGGVYPSQPVQVIVYTANDFSHATAAGDHVGALYDGKIRVPIDDKQGNQLSKSELRRRLYHEYTHVVVRYIGGDKIPWWLNEGLAETLSRHLDESMIKKLNEAYDEHTIFALQDLEKSQLGRLNPDQLALAYRQAHATVDYLIRRFGQRKFVVLLQTIASGVPTEDALKQVYRRRYAEIEREVAQTIRHG